MYIRNACFLMHYYLQIQHEARLKLTFEGVLSVVEKLIATATGLIEMIVLSCISIKDWGPDTACLISSTAIIVVTRMKTRLISNFLAFTPPCWACLPKQQRFPYIVSCIHTYIRDWGVTFPSELIARPWYVEYLTISNITYTQSRQHFLWEIVFICCHISDAWWWELPLLKVPWFLVLMFDLFFLLLNVLSIKGLRLGRGKWKDLCCQIYRVCSFIMSLNCFQDLVKLKLLFILIKDIRERAQGSW